MELLKTLYQIYSPSYGEKRMKRFIKRWVRYNVPNASIFADGRNLYITKGKSETYPCVVAHLDQVQKTHSKDFVAVETEHIIFGYSPSNREHEGLGADDKNGIWVALKCLQKYDAIKVAFFYGEEVGCVGSSRAYMPFFDDCRFVIEPDRRGYGDLITSIGYEQICSDEFVKTIDPKLFGYEEEHGLMTDVESLRDNGLEISCINLSCGYYEPHTDREYTVKADLLNCLAFVEHIIETVQEVSKFEGFYYPRSWERGYNWYTDYPSLFSDKRNKATTFTASKPKTQEEPVKKATVYPITEAKKAETDWTYIDPIVEADLTYVLDNEFFMDFSDFLDSYGEFFENVPEETLKREYEKRYGVTYVKK